MKTMWILTALAVVISLTMPGRATAGSDGKINTAAALTAGSIYLLTQDKTKEAAITGAMAADAWNQAEKARQQEKQRIDQLNRCRYPLGRADDRDWRCVNEPRNGGYQTGCWQDVRDFQGVQTGRERRVYGAPTCPCCQYCRQDECQYKQPDYRWNKGRQVCDHKPCCETTWKRQRRSTDNWHSNGRWQNAGDARWDDSSCRDGWAGRNDFITPTVNTWVRK